MAYPGEPTLDPKVQQRILTAFAEAVRLYREGHNEESRTVLRSIADVDPRFTPAQRLEQAITAGAPVDLGQLIGEVTAHPGVDVEATVAKARQALAQRDFASALTSAQAALRELPGHAEARQIAIEAQTRQRATGDVDAHLVRARNALDAGLAEEARGFLRLAQNSDPTHPDIPALERRLQLAAKPLAVEPEPEFEFEVFEPPAPAAPPAPQPPPTPLQPTPQPGVPRPAAAAPPPRAPHAPIPPAAAPPPQPAPPVAPTAPAGAVFPTAPAFAFDEGGDLPPIEFGGGAGAEAPAHAPAEDAATRVQALLDQGQQEFDRGDFHAAIDTWSRIYLIDAHHPEAERRIEQARRRREEVERLAEHKFYEAREAFDQGRWDDARALCQEVLGLQPQHLEAHDLLLRLETPAAPPPPPAATAAEEDDLFRDDFVPARISSSGASPAMAESVAATAEEGAVARPAARTAPKRGKGVRFVWLAVGVGLLAVLAVAGFMLRGKVFSGSSGAVTEAVAEADRLSKAGRMQEAVQLLQSLQGQAEGDQATLVNQRILDLQRRLKARAAVPKSADVRPVREALAAGNHVKALTLVRDGLAASPGDAELNRIQSEIVAYSPLVPALADAAAKHNWESVRQLAADVMGQHPGDAEAQRLWAAGTYNLAVTLLRKYQVTQANELLLELEKTGDDAEVTRLQKFAKSYLARPVDPRYQFFVADLEFRALD